MKYSNGKEPMRGDAVVAPDGQGGAVVGTVHELYDRTSQLRISGYPLRVYAADAVLASDALAAFMKAQIADNV